VMLAGSTARIAADSDALIVPVRPRRDGFSAWVDVGEALDPRQHAGMEELHDALASAHERWMLELPETLEDPTRPGGWAAEPNGTVQPQDDWTDRRSTAEVRRSGPPL
jgi:hypothetical protein